MKSFKRQLNYWTHMLDEAFDKRVLNEGKHWPEDYIKTAFNTIKASQLGQQSWYTDEYIKTDLNNIAQEFGPLSHKNSNLGFFATIIRWFIEYSGNSQQKYQEFLERKLDGIIRDLQIILNDPKLDQTKRDQLKKISFSEFEKMQKENADKLKASDIAFSGVESNKYDLIFIPSYEELHKQFGGDKTGYEGKSEWCHTNGKSTYESWTSNGTRFFFVLAKKGWESISPLDPTTTNAYDEYGTSLIAILVDQSGEFLNATLRWNHNIEPSRTKPGTSVDRAFLTYADLSNTVRMDVKSKVLEILKTRNVYSKYGKIVYDGPEGRCAVYDGHLLWIDENDNEIYTPERVGGNFDCSNNKLTSLEGAPREVKGNFYCSYSGLTSLEGAPREVGGDFICSGNNLTSLEGAPQKVGRGFYCSSNKLTSLEGAPREVGGGFDCLYNKLTSLEGAPREVGGDFWCSDNKLTSLEGAPQEVGIGFYCSRNNLTSKQVTAYTEWLKISPTKPYHDPYTE